MKSIERAKGDKGEDVACSYLKKRGYGILARNCANRFGELDIVAKKNGAIVFIEVKSQYAFSGLNPERSVDWRKQKKIIRAAEWFLIEQGYADATHWQIDVIVVELDTKIRRANLRHLQGVVHL